MIRSISLAASLFAGLTLAAAASVMAADETLSKPLSGDDIARHINTVLAENNIPGTPQINPAEQHNPCPAHIVAAPLFNNWKTIKVTCPANKQWRLLVRVILDRDTMIKASQPAQPARVKTPSRQDAAHQALALRRSMAKGEVILEGDIVKVAISAQQNYGVFHKASDVIGRRVRTPISAQAPIKSRQLEPKYLVEEKKPVIIALSINGIYVEMSGISLQDGQLGESVKVENATSGKTITGKVIGFRKISPMH